MDTLNDQTTFTFAGKCDDEVTFTFDNTEDQLFVSRNFLSLVSPVFRTMFTSEFIEKTTGVVEMKDQEYDDVLEFLLVLHPCDFRKPITVTNVYIVFQLADQYQIDSVIKRCKATLIRILRNNFKLIVDDAYNNDKKTELEKTEAAYSCITVLSTVFLYSCKSLKNMALDIISRFGSKVFLNTKLLMTDGEVYDENIWEIYGDFIKKKESPYTTRNKFVGFFGTKSWINDMTNVVLKRKACRDAFSQLPDDIKMKILQNRLENIEDNNICASEKYI